MSYDQKPNTGALFVNDRKSKDAHPDRSGKINVEGKLYYLDGWLKQDKNGKPWLSLSVKPIEPRTETAPVQQRPVTGTIADMQDDVPFAPIGRGIGGHAI